MKRKIILYSIISFFIGGISGYFAFIIRGVPDAKLIEYYTPPLSTRLYDVHNRLIKELYIQKRVPVPLDSIPPYAIQATISVEDKDFFKHYGIDFKRIVKSIIVDIIKHRYAQGASTITQQLARNLFLTPKKSITRKLREALLALMIERYYSKEEILNMYMNQIYYGNGNYGIEAASEYYFGKPVSQLSINESALLAGLPRGPGYYSPFKYPKRAKRRRNVVLNAMERAGYLDSNTVQILKQEPIEVVKREEKKKIGPYFIQEVIKKLNRLFGKEYLTMGGYTVYTTMDMDMQSVADSVVETGCKRAERIFKLTPKDSFSDSTINPLNIPYIEGALVAIAPHSGGIRALVGGRNFKHSKFNRATMARRQAGSSFKIFLYTAAIDNGYSPSNMILDAPIVEEIQGKIYAPANYDSTFLGKISLRKALALSRNLASLRLIKQVGVFTTIDYAHKMGIKSPLKPVLSLPLGTCGVTPLEMANGYATIANYGVRISPYYIDSIKDRNGNLVYTHLPIRERVLSPATSYIMIDMMKSVFNHGTAYGARRMGFRCPAAGKTGTTDNYTDAWFVGFVPDLIISTWMGYDTPKRIGKGATGARIALPVWVNFMKGIGDTTNQDFPVPDGVVKKYVCTASGLLPTKYCPRVRQEVFLRGNEPEKYCNIHSPHPKIKENVPFERMDR